MAFTTCTLDICSRHDGPIM